MLPGPYTYRISAYDSSNNFITNSDPVIAYRAVTDTEFFHVYNETMTNAEEKANFGATSDQQADGDLNGTVVYDIELLAADVLITFTDYIDYYIELDGIIFTDSDWGGNGTTVGTNYLTGIYPGTVYTDLTITDKVSSGGSYTVVQEGSTPTVLPYTVAQ